VQQIAPSTMPDWIAGKMSPHAIVVAWKPRLSTMDFTTLDDHTRMFMPLSSKVF
jgi:hypothetical protein